jgi:hypothetical protein
MTGGRGLQGCASFIWEGGTWRRLTRQSQGPKLKIVNIDVSGSSLQQIILHAKQTTEQVY